MGRINIQTVEKGRKKAVDPCFEPCPIERGMRIIGGKWTGSILWHLKDEPVRFNDLARQLSGASKKVISDRLKEMENNQLITRTVISTRPIAVTYEITDFGCTALEFLETLKEWVEKHHEIIA
ncbi:MAG: winged helix-turn-helix transcriptional regulator [Crocosphaera sp.]